MHHQLKRKLTGLFKNVVLLHLNLDNDKKCGIIVQGITIKSSQYWGNSMPGLSSLQVDIKKQPHNLAWINKEEQSLLKDLGGSGRPGPMGIPAYEFSYDDDQDLGDVTGSPGGAAGASGGGAGAGGGTGGGSGNDGDGGGGWSEPDDPHPEDFSWSVDKGFTGPTERSETTTSSDLETIGWEDIGPPLGWLEKAMTKAEEEAFFSTDGVRDPDFLDLGIYQNIAGPNWKTPTTGPNAGKKTGDFIEVQPKSVNWNPGSPILEAIVNFIQSALPGSFLGKALGINVGDAFGPSMVEVNHDGTPKDASIGPDTYEEEGDEEVEVEIIEEETPPSVGAMEQYFKDREDSTTTAIDETNNIVERLGIQNRTIEPFKQWLAEQSEAMKEADRTTQIKKYRESLVRKKPSSGQSYLPLVHPIRDRITEQKFMDTLYRPDKKPLATLYRPDKKPLATQALFDELGI